MSAAGVASLQLMLQLVLYLISTVCAASLQLVLNFCSFCCMSAAVVAVLQLLLHLCTAASAASLQLVLYLCS